MSSARKTALNIISRIDSGGFSNLVLKQMLNDSDISERDRAFVSNLVYGVIERKLTLDFGVEKLSGRSVKKIDSLALQCIRLGLYQLWYMDKVPESAAINESVKLVKMSHKAFLSGFVNAVLRNAQRQKGPVLPKDDGSANALSVIYSCPEWIVQRLIDDYGYDNTVGILKHSLEKKDITVKVNTLKIDVNGLINQFSDLGVEVVKTQVKNVILLKNPGSIEKNELYKNGYFHVQDCASAICAESIDSVSGCRVLDMCAAPGGKTFSIAENMGDIGEIVACDIHKHRTKLISNGAERLGLKIIKPMVLDATIFCDRLGKFDRVLCDVPCSGLGVIGKKPDIKYKDESEFAQLPQIQYNIICNASKYLLDGGRLVYSTCTLSKRENEEVVARFIKNNPQFKVVSMKTYFPLTDGTDGFFICVLTR
ncbi:MAG: 16S rRNA (cytosine(967)-C(5))-methyltransferase RsmB [bacterium]|nr:16S rRNA (cytosine(967)-C(5))-methyltransferase RsmB [bacterium]